MNVICDNRSIDCNACEFARVHDHMYRALRRTACYNGIAAKDDPYISHKYTDYNFKPVKAQTIYTQDQIAGTKGVQAFKSSYTIDTKKLKESLMNRTKEKEIISALQKVTYDNDELNVLKATVLSYKTMLDDVCDSLGFIDKSEMLTVINSIKNCDNCDVDEEEQYIPDNECERRCCKRVDGVLTGWRNSKSIANEEHISIMSKEEIENIIDWELR